MAEENQTSKSDSSAPSGRLLPLVVLWRRFFGPKPPPVPLWSGICDCCKRDIQSFEQTFPEGAKVECMACIVGLSETGKKRRENRRQIELYKQAIRELEEEKHNVLAHKPGADE
jgi:hypothetical protein